MKELFETFKPKSKSILPYVDYYYLDIKPHNRVTEFQCFPHYNNTLSLYQSHIRLHNNEMAYDENAKPFQIFTPIREKTLQVKQSGKVHRIVIVFHPLGIHHFYKNVNFTDYIVDFSFFNAPELDQLFSTTNTELLTESLDQFLEKRLLNFKNQILEKAIASIFTPYDHFNVKDLASDLNISRQHLNRVFQSHLGISVKKFHEIVVFRQTINQKLFENPEANFTELAHAFNYNDQSHLNKVYKKLTHNAPKSFFTKGSLLGDEDTFWHLEP